MTPSHVRKRGIKYRYYLSVGPAPGPPETGSVSRIPAEIEGLVTRSVRDHLNQSAEIEDAVAIQDLRWPDRGPIRSVGDRADRRNQWLKAVARPQCAEGTVAQVALKRRREILVPDPSAARRPPNPFREPRSPDRIDRAGRRWLNELIADPTANAGASRRETAAASARST